jgi:hypothetical protein
MIRIRNTSVNRAYGSALGLIKMSFTLNAFFMIDHIDIIPGSDGGRRTFRFAGAAIDTFFID